MKSATSAQRPYQEVGAMIRDLIIKTPYNPGERLPPEREIAEMLDVTRTVVREALIMLEIKGLVEVRRGAGIYVLDSSGSHNTDSPDANVCNDAGPFELLQARQLLESNIAEFAALQATAAQQIGVSDLLLVAANTTGGVTGKMISPQSIAIACAAVGLVGKESDLFRFTVKHSLIFTCMVGVITTLQAYVLTWMIP